MTPKSFYAMLSEPGANLLCKVRGFSAGRKGRTANLRDMMALPCRRVRLWIATIGIEAVAGLIVLGFVNAPPIRAQSAPTANAPLLSFEVASVKRSFPGESTSFHVLPNRFTVRAYLIKMLILVVYGQDLGEFGLSELRFNQIEGGPKWIYSDGFTYDGYDIDAKVDDSLAEKFGKDCGVAFSRGRCGYRNQMLLMVQSLLADRFKLQVRHEKRELPVYALVVANGGPKFLHTVFAVPDYTGLLQLPQRPPCPAGMSCMHDYMSMSLMAERLSRMLANERPVIDQTGLKGGYYINLQWAPPQSPSRTSMGSENGNAGMDITLPPQSSGPSLSTVLEKQLGLKLVPTKGPVDFLVIDHIERPSEN